MENILCISLRRSSSAITGGTVFMSSIFLLLSNSFRDSSPIRTSVSSRNIMESINCAALQKLILDFLCTSLLIVSKFAVNKKRNIPCEKCLIISWFSAVLLLWSTREGWRERETRIDWVGLKTKTRETLDWKGISADSEGQERIVKLVAIAHTANQQICPSWSSSLFPDVCRMLIVDSNSTT